MGRDQHRGARARRVRRGRRAARRDGRRPGRRRAALRLAVRAARARLPRHRAGARRRARGQGRLHGRARALDRRAGRAGRVAARPRRRRPARPALRRGLPRHRQDRRARGDPLQARPAHRPRSGRSWSATRSPASRSSRPVEFLAGVRALVRHEHERWDGARLPRQARRRGDPARLADHPRLRRAARDDQRPPVPRGALARGRGRGAAPQRRHAVRPARGRGAAGGPGRIADARAHGSRAYRG